ncbi:MAG: hypothetical protein LBG84_08720 [Treponema sp.]|jgi:hypothetical protein|nr:hypothetical protein [Treponema sp.]
MGFLDGLISELTGDYTGTDASNGSKLGSMLGGLLKQGAADLTTGGDTSYNGAVQGGSDGKFKRKVWANSLSEEGAAAVVQGFLQPGWRIEKCYCMGSNLDAQDLKMVNDLEGYMSNNYQIGNGEAFSHLVDRSSTNAGCDGWVVFSHFLNSEGWFHYVFYFAIAFN